MTFPTEWKVIKFHGSKQPTSFILTYINHPFFRAPIWTAFFFGRRKAPLHSHGHQARRRGLGLLRPTVAAQQLEVTAAHGCSGSTFLDSQRPMDHPDHPTGNWLVTLVTSMAVSGTD